ncbi:MAG: hypothetical protein AAFZ02_11150 [Pseudomonadota bacterium]
MTGGIPEKELSEAELEAFFAASDRAAPLPSADLFARILADAEAEQARTPEAPQVPARGWAARLADTLGGWAGISGLAGAVATGLIVGIFPPDALLSLTDGLFAASTFSDYVPAFDAVAFDG